MSNSHCLDRRRCQSFNANSAIACPLCSRVLCRKVRQLKGTIQTSPADHNVQTIRHAEEDTLLARGMLSPCHCNVKSTYFTLKRRRDDYQLAKVPFTFRTVSMVPQSGLVPSMKHPACCIIGATTRLLGTLPLPTRLGVSTLLSREFVTDPKFRAPSNIRNTR